MFKVEIAKTDYPSGVGPQCGMHSEFEITLHTPNCHLGHITRKKLEKLYKDLGNILNITEKPRYVDGNTSSIKISITANEKGDR